MKKIISILLVVMMLLSAFGTIAFADLSTATGYTVADSALTIQPKKSEINIGANESNTNIYEPYQIIEYPPHSNAEYDRFFIVRYDISEIPETAENITATIGFDKNISSYDTFFNKDFEIAAYALENAVWNWTGSERGSRTITYADIFTNPPTDATSFRKHKKLTSVTPKTNAELITHSSSTSTYANGAKLLFNIDDYVREIKATNPSQQYITLGYAIENYTTEALTVHFKGVYFSNSVGNADEFKPHIFWNDSGRSQDNTLVNVTVENGILIEDFSPYTNEYKIAVIDNSKDVTISYVKTDAPSYVSNEVLTGNLSGTKTLSIPVTSEGGKTRNYTFKLLTLAESGLNFEKPTLDKVYRTSFNPIDNNGKNLLYLYNNTNIKDGKTISGAGIELYSTVFGKADIKADSNTVSYANTNGLFGFRVIPMGAKAGNTFVAVPNYSYKNATFKGEEYIIKAAGEDSQATITKPNAILNYNTPVYYNNVSYSLKETAVKNMTGDIKYNGDVLGMDGWASNAIDTRQRTQVILQFALTDAMLTAENINLTLGVNDNFEANKYKTLISYKPTLVVSEVTNLNNTWNNKDIKSKLLKEGETDFAKTTISTYMLNESNLARNEDSNAHKGGNIYKLGGEEFTDYIKQKIISGNKMINICVEITDIETFREEDKTSGYGIYILGTSNVPNINIYSGGRSYLEPLLTALRW